MTATNYVPTAIRLLVTGGEILEPASSRRIKATEDGLTVGGTVFSVWHNGRTNSADAVHDWLSGPEVGDRIPEGIAKAAAELLAYSWVDGTPTPIDE